MKLFEVETHQLVKRFYKVRGEDILDAHKNLIENKGAEDMKIEHEDENIFVTKLIGPVPEEES